LDRFFDFSSTFGLASGCDVRLRMEVGMLRNFNTVRYGTVLFE